MESSFSQKKDEKVTCFSGGQGGWGGIVLRKPVVSHYKLINVQTKMMKRRQVRLGRLLIALGSCPASQEMTRLGSRVGLDSNDLTALLVKEFCPPQGKIMETNLI